MQQAVRSDCYHNMETNDVKVSLLVDRSALHLVEHIKQGRLEWLGLVIKME
jgi:hypothetical protein